MPLTIGTTTVTAGWKCYVATSKGVHSKSHCSVLPPWENLSVWYPVSAQGCTEWSRTSLGNRLWNSPLPSSTHSNCISRLKAKRKVNLPENFLLPGKFTTKSGLYSACSCLVADARTCRPKQAGSWNCHQGLCPFKIFPNCFYRQSPARRPLQPT